MRPKGSAQFEGDLDSALKAFIRKADDRRESLMHASATLARMSRDCTAKRQEMDRTDADNDPRFADCLEAT